MDDRQIKMPAKKKTAVREEEDVEIVSQRQKPDVGRYLLQVDRQTKGSFHTSEDAQAAALEIKKAFPVLQVSIYDRVTSTTLADLFTPLLRVDPGSAVGTSPRA
jgi:hypothetical protein